MLKFSVIKKIVTLESAGLAAIILFVWLVEIFDLPHLLFSAPATGINVWESLMETGVVALLGGLLIFATIAKGEVERVREKTDAIVKGMDDALLVCDTNRRIIRANQAACDLLHLPLLDTNVHYVDELPNHLRGQIESAFRDESASPLIWEVPGEENTEKRTMESRSNLARGSGGNKIGVITLIRDVTQKYELDRMKDEFISTAAHELRTPLTAIKGFTEVLLDTPFPPDQQQELLQLVFNNAATLESIIADLLDLSRVHSGKVIQLQKEICDLPLLIRNVSNTYRTLYPLHRFDLRLPEGETKILADRKKLEQVFHNLISNAAKYSHQNGTVTISCERDDAQVLITVADNGIGMKPEEVEKIFDKFYRVDASNTALPGLGLGMAIVKNIVEGHGGEIRVASKPKEGTTVSFTLPHRPAA